MAYLTGKLITPRTAKEARALIGKRVTYLRKADIDYSGRGLFFPRTGTIKAVFRKNIALDDEGNFELYMPDLVEMVENV